MFCIGFAFCAVIGFTIQAARKYRDCMRENRLLADAKNQAVATSDRLSLENIQLREQVQAYTEETEKLRKIITDLENSPIKALKHKDLITVEEMQSFELKATRWINEINQDLEVVRLKMVQTGQAIAESLERGYYIRGATHKIAVEPPNFADLFNFKIESNDCKDGAK